jgi:hypothetical protein
MQTRHRNLFTTIHTEGAILPPDLLQRIASGDSDVEGLTPEAYHLIKGERLNEGINRSWSRLQGAWSRLIALSGLARLPESELGTSLTRERWLLPLFGELGYGRLLTSRSIEVDGKDYPISHLWGNTPIHLVGCRVTLDGRTPGVAGAARSSPHSLVQELLNRSDDHLWAFVSNGLRLRLLRDNASLTRQAYVEFDLEAMMDGEVYADFVLLWLLCHQSRVEALPSSPPLVGGTGGGVCWLEKWSRTAQEQGTRALEQLRNGVEAAINALGRGFLVHPANRELREKLRAGTLDKQEYYRQLLRLVYRLLFLFVAEDRGLLLDPHAEEVARERYTRFYSTARIRRLAERHKGTRHADLVYGLWLVMEKLGDDAGCPQLGLPALGGFLFSKGAMPDLHGLEIANADLLAAVRALAFIIDGNTRRPVDYKNLRSEELGSVYEALLELHPNLNADVGTFELQTAGGHERKTTGSYYTPDSLVQCLLDSALEPVLDEQISNQANEPVEGRSVIRNPQSAIRNLREAAILNLKVCDPACGSGHFLIAAAHRMARRLAAARTGDEEPAPEATQTALRDVIGHCIYGVDINPMAVELCKVSLWMEALEPGKPLSFLDHRIRCGNSLLGTTPALLEKGIPDDAFNPIEGDDKAIASALKRQNKEERRGQETFFADLIAESGVGYANLSRGFTTLDHIDDSSMIGIREKEARYHQLADSADHRHSRLLADAWCAAFVWRKTRNAIEPVTENLFRRLASRPDDVSPKIRQEIRRLAESYQFLHWHLAYPDVFRVPGADEAPENEGTGWSGGFDVVLGNPPWERIKLQEKEWFATRRPDIANAPNAAARRRMIDALKTEDPALYAAFLDDRRKAEGESHLARNSGRFPLCGRGDINTYSIFAETNRTLINPKGRVGCIVPSGIATDDTTKFFFQGLMDTQSLVSLYDFENREKLFPAVDSRMKFCTLTLTGAERPAKRGAEFVFFAHLTDDLDEVDRRFTLSAEEIRLLNPNTRTCPIFRSQRDAELTKAIYRRVPVLIREGVEDENPWGISFKIMFHMAGDSYLFRTREQLEADRDYLRLYEAKMMHQFDHCWATYEGLETRDLTFKERNNPNWSVVGRYWVEAQEVNQRLGVEEGDRNFSWLLGVRNITNTTNERTAIFTILPRAAIGHAIPLVFFNSIPITISDVKVYCTGFIAGLETNFNSFVFDYVVRQKMGGTNFTYFILKQLPVLPPDHYTPNDLAFILPRVLELTYTAWDLQPFAVDCGYDGPPFRWDEARRFLIRCELDALYFHLYGIERDDVDYIMETFPIVKRKDEARYGEYRTKRVILEIYDAMGEAKRTGQPYQTRLAPPAAHPSVAHPPRG